MITVSLCMVLKNKESMMKRCLDSVSDIFDEIIILDLGSSDKTKEIAKQYTQKVYDFFWDDDFSQVVLKSYDGLLYVDECRGSFIRAGSQGTDSF